MTKQEIELLFNEAIQTMAIDRKLEGVSKDVIYNWRKNRGNPPATGKMIDVLWQLGKIKITHEPTTEP
jgi:hypothetical protein